MRRSSASALAVLAMAFLPACESTSDGQEFYTGPFAYAEIILEPSILVPGGTARAHLVAFSDLGDTLGEVETRWGGDHPVVATVDSSGLIHALSTGRVILTSTAFETPRHSDMYVSPDSACGHGIEVSDWLVTGAFVWVDSAASGDSAIVAHHNGNWSIVADAPRQDTDGEIMWRFRLPLGSQGVALTRSDTFRVGAVRRVNRGRVDLDDRKRGSGEVRLDLTTCKLSARAAVWTADSFFKVRPGAGDSLIESVGTWQWLAFATVEAGNLISSTPIDLGGNWPVVLPIDAMPLFGYAPSGYSAYVAGWDSTPVPIALTLTATPSWTAPSAARRR
jgi:hypothetical protein